MSGLDGIFLSTCGFGKEQDTVTAQIEHERQLEDLREQFAHALGNWVGCDWPTDFGRYHLNLQGLRADHAVLMARATAGSEANAWWEASRWLARIETEAAEAESAARLALAKANSREWVQALAHARFACDIEARYHTWLVWQPLRDSIENALRTSNRTY